MSLTPGTKLGPYEILARLGAGGMGEVYKAKDLKLGRDVAIKVLREDLASAPERLRRFEQEARAASSLNHPNIVTIHDIGEHEGTRYIAMEYVEGKTLREMLVGEPLPTKKLLKLSTQIADGLAKAHSAGIVHRDLKPENLMVTKDGFVKILDFGLAKLRPSLSEMDSEAATVTKEGTILGTVGYMSPEQAKGQPADFRSDHFSFGAILYEMATGRRAFQRDSSVQTLSAIIEDCPEPIPSSTDFPLRLRALVDRCLSKAPEQRYGATLDLARDLKDIHEELLSRSLNGLPRHSQTESIDSIAVLPLANLSPEPGQEYFADGMTEALITDLAKIGALKVISRTSAMRYKGTDKTVPEIARELNVASVLEGSVLRAGNRVRITAQLIEAATDQHLWAESYERDLRDILTLQSEVARAVAREVQVKLTPGEESRLAQTRPVNEKAHEAYLKGRSLWNQNTADAIRRARDYFEEAIAIEPSYALAYAWLAQTHSAVGWYGTLPPKEALPKSKAVATKALQMDETLAEAYVSLGYSSTFYDWDWTAGERELTRAIELDPSSDRAHLSYFWFLVAQNRLDEAASEIHRAEELDPFSPMIRMNVGFYFWWARDPDRAIEHYLKLLELNPNSEEVHFFLGAAYLQMSMHGDAITEFERTLELSPGSTRNLAWLGHARALAGQRDEALAIVTQLMELSKRQYVSSYEVARIYAGLGDHDQVFTWLDRAYEERASWMAYLQVDPTLDPFRSDPRFQDLLRRMNFPES